MADEAEARKQYADAGVDLPELQEGAEEPAKEPEAPSAPEQGKEPAEPEQPAKEPEHLQTPKPEEPQRKRTIYDDYKDKKLEAKEAVARAEQAEKERDELAEKLRIASEAKAGTDTADATEDAIAYAKKVGADPDLVQRIIADARKGVAPTTDESLKKDLEEFKAWKSQNQHVLEKQMFEEEFQKSTPALKELFPTATPEELGAIKQELDVLSHTKEWHDKSLDYVAFKNKGTLAALISPKKRGMETKGRQDVEVTNFEFDPNADYSKMTSAQREEWEKHYKEATRSDGLMTDSEGRKSIL